MTEDKIIIKIDFSNAFNTLRRDTILEAVQQYFPELLPYASSTYNETSNLCFGKFSIDSAEGCQQGDPLGPLYFCLSIHKLLTSFKSEFVVGYLDDLTIGDHVDKAIEDFLILEAEASKLGLHLNRSKCEINGILDLSRTQLKEKGILLNETESAAACLLGSPLHMDGISQAIINKRSDLKIMSTRLSYMPAHDSLFLLKNALAIPKLMYILCSSPCFDNDELINYDNDLRNMLSKILNIDLSDDGWEQASLPVRCGGLGIRSAVSLAPSAYLASAAGSASLVSNAPSEILGSSMLPIDRCKAIIQVCVIIRSSSTTSISIIGFRSLVGSIAAHIHRIEAG